jgi:hypothetical protein
MHIPATHGRAANEQVRIWPLFGYVTRLPPHEEEQQVAATLAAAADDSLLVQHCRV